MCRIHLNVCFLMCVAMEGDGNKGTWHSKVVNKVRRIGNTTSNVIPPYQAQGSYEGFVFLVNIVIILNGLLSSKCLLYILRNVF